MSNALPVLVPLLLSFSFSTARAQEFRPVLKVGDALGAEHIAAIDSTIIDDHGDWHSIVLRNVRTHSLNGSLLRDGVAVLSEGAAVPEVSAGLRRLIEVSGSGSNPSVLALLDGFHPPLPIAPSAFLRGGHVVLLQTRPVLADGLSPSTVCGTVETLAANEHDTVLAVVRLDGGADDRALLRFAFDPDGSTRTRELLVRSGDVLLDGSTVRTIPLDERTVALNERGEWLVRVRTTDGRDRLLSETGVELRTGQPSPFPGRRIASILPSFDRNDLGGQAASVQLEGSAVPQRLLLKNGGILAQQGDVVPSRSALIPDLVIEDFGKVQISDSGNVYWQLLGTPRSRATGAFMRDSQLILQAGASLAGGELVTSFAFSADNFTISPSGRFWIGRVDLQVSGESLVTADFGAAVPLPGCTPNPATLRLTGGLVLAGATPELSLDGPLPTGSIGRVHFSLGAASPSSQCGITTRFGEVLIDPSRVVTTRIAGRFAGGPVTLRFPIPPDLALVDQKLFAQGSFQDPGGGITLTNGLMLEIGAP